jgi:hypothetical protein
MPHAQLPIHASLTKAMKMICEFLAEECDDWLVRENYLEFWDFRWDISTSRRLSASTKQAVKDAIYNSVPARFRVRVTFSSVKKWRWEKRED